MEEFQENYAGGTKVQDIRSDARKVCLTNVIKSRMIQVRALCDANDHYIFLSPG